MRSDHRDRLRGHRISQRTILFQPKDIVGHPGAMKNCSVTPAVWGGNDDPLVIEEGMRGIRRFAAQHVQPGAGDETVNHRDQQILLIHDGSPADIRAFQESGVYKASLTNGTIDHLNNPTQYGKNGESEKH